MTPEMEHSEHSQRKKKTADEKSSEMFQDGKKHQASVRVTRAILLTSEAIETL